MKIGIYRLELGRDSMRGRVPSVVFSVFLLGALSGCTFLDESDNGFDLNVEFDFSNNTIIETYSDGELESLRGVLVDLTSQIQRLIYNSLELTKMMEVS